MHSLASWCATQFVVDLVHDFKQNTTEHVKVMGDKQAEHYARQKLTSQTASQTWNDPTPLSNIWNIHHTSDISHGRQDVAMPPVCLPVYT